MAVVLRVGSYIEVKLRVGAQVVRKGENVFDHVSDFGPFI